MNIMAGNRDPIAFDHPEEYIPERWMNGRKGRTDMPGEGGEKLGVSHLTYGCGRRVCPGIDSKYRITMLPIPNQYLPTCSRSAQS
jgi:cytochrome P450